MLIIFTKIIPTKISDIKSFFDTCRNNKHKNFSISELSTQEIIIIIIIASLKLKIL